MKRAPIPFISRYDEAHAKSWITALNAALPDEEVVLPSTLTEEAKAAARFAIVGGPFAEHFAGFTGLEWVQSTWAGIESADAALPTKVHITRLVDPWLTATMVEAVLAWTLYLHRDMPTYRAQQARREWRKQPYRRATDTTIGLLGLGELGHASALNLVGQGFNVCGWSRSPKQIAGVDSFTGADGLREVLAKADVLVCLLPLTKHTHGLLDRAAFAKTKPGAGFINFARGPIVRTDALLDALDAGNLSHAVLDVFDVEPLPIDSPLWDHPDVTILPHVSALTQASSAVDVVAANVRRWRATGQLPEAIDRERGY